MTVRECFDKGLLRKGTPRQDIARKELSQAEFFIKEAEELLEMDIKKRHNRILEPTMARVRVLRVFPTSVATKNFLTSYFIAPQ